MPYMTTFTGKHFDPASPDPALIDARDIAHALSLITRGNGHVKTFWSVASHCLACEAEAAARDFSARVRLACLLHDAGEAYLCDLIRPVKDLLPAYERVETRLLETIWNVFLDRPLTAAERELVFAIDDDMLSCDFHFLMAEDLGDRWKNVRALPDYRFAPFAEVETEYIRRLDVLRGEL
ncbi:MAG: phosphohydrolase [Pyramidobacter sp.]|nr:phosphohydrolase [Pyramidobacter sp.]